MSVSAVRSFSDPYEYQRSFRGADIVLSVTAPGEYRAELMRVDFNQLWIQRSHASLSHITHSAVLPDRRFVFFLADADQAPMLHSGKELSSNEVMFYSPAAELHRRSVGPSRWAAMSLPAADFTLAASLAAGRELRAPSQTSMIRPPATLLARLRALHAAAGNLAATVPDILGHPEVARAIEQELIGAMLSCLVEGEQVGKNAPAYPRMSVMRRFEQLLKEMQGHPLYLTEVSAAIGVSTRTLRLHCMEHLGMNPHRYLWIRRMNLARRALVMADPSAATVTGIAADHGFWEFGRFAVAYRRLFGEAPSATLRHVP